MQLKQLEKEPQIVCPKGGRGEEKLKIGTEVNKTLKRKEERILTTPKAYFLKRLI